MIKKTVLLECLVEIEFDETLLPDDEWRKTFYNINTFGQLAEHLAYNKVVNHLDLSEMDGFCDKSDDQMEIVREQWDVSCFM